MKKIFNVIQITIIYILTTQVVYAADQLPRPDPAFKGKMGVTTKESTPHWPEMVKAPKGAPNVVVIMLDDIGFGDSSTFGGPAQTPALDKLAAEGLRYNNFHTTAVCSPTRAALLTGRNHHRVGFGGITSMALGYPGYNTIWKKNTASVAEILRQNGYSTAAFGKWHNTPEWEYTPKGPFDRWPTGLGFEYFYGFMGSGAENQWEPSNLYRNTTPVAPTKTAAQGYHFTADLADDAIGWMKTHNSLAADKPYFLYFATGAVHAPHHAPKAWIEKYKGKFDQGWDKLRDETYARQKKLGVIPADTKLNPRPAQIPAWDSLSSDQKKLYARQMEIYAAFVAHTDAQVGRLIDAVKAGPDADNTIIMYIVGDNGAAGLRPIDGIASGMRTVQDQLQHLDDLGSVKIPFYGASGGWGWAGSAPFQWWKGVASHFGGTRNPLVVSWPDKIKKKGELRSQFSHVNDVAATLYDVANIKFPSKVNGIKQQPLDGVSFAHTFDRAKAPSHHHTQYFETWGNRGIYQNGWMASAHRQGMDPMDSEWELYHVAKDFSQANDLAKKYPQKLESLKAIFDEEARKNDVYPLLNSYTKGIPHPLHGKTEMTYSPDTGRVPFPSLPPFGKVSYGLTVTATIPKDGAEGILVSRGNRMNGFVLYVKDGKIIYENQAGKHHNVITTSQPLITGDVTIRFEFDRDAEKSKHVKGRGLVGAGTGRLYINGTLSGEAIFPAVGNARSTALYIGRAMGSPVSQAYTQPFPFTGRLEQIKVNWK